MVQKPDKGPGRRMRSETIAIYGGYDVDPTTKAVAVPIYETVAYAFDSADLSGALVA
jgi:O-acetylhomoserine (thiol)-lyase